MPRRRVSQILFLDDHLSNAPDFDIKASSFVGSRIAAGRIATFHPSIISVRHCCSNWILRPSPYGDHHALRCLDFPVRQRRTDYPSSQAPILYNYIFFSSIISAAIICITTANGTANKAPAIPSNLLPIAMARITIKGFKPTALFIT